MTLSHRETFLTGGYTDDVGPSCTILRDAKSRICRHDCAGRRHAGSFACAEPVSSLKPTDCVNDFAGVLSPRPRPNSRKCVARCWTRPRRRWWWRRSSRPTAKISSTIPSSCIRSGESGRKGKDRGVLILLAVQDRKYQIRVGYGLEPILPDGKVGGFGREAVPYLKRADYDGAVSLLTSRIVDVIAKDAGVEITTSQPRLVEPLTSSPPDTRLSPVQGSRDHRSHHPRAGRAAFTRLLFYMFLFGGGGAAAIAVAVAGAAGVSVEVAEVLAASVEAVPAGAARAVAGNAINIEGPYGF